jgi:glycosyltransferase involved in cell wall biosynthesis
VLVLNHFAVPRDEPGGTRHVELFGRLDGWSSLVVASRLNLTTGEPQAPEPGFLPVPVLAYEGNGVRRVLNWVSYAATATWAGLRQPRADVVYGSSPHLLAGLAAWLLARVRRSTFVLEVRDLWPQVLLDMGQLTAESRVYRLLEQLEGFLYRNAAAVVVMAPGSRRHVEARGVAPQDVVYIPNAADPDDFRPSAPRDELRRRYGFDRLTFVYTGAHGPANGLDLLLDAVATIDDLDIEVVLVGSGVEKGRLVSRVSDEGVQRLRFMDAVPKTEIADVLAAADVGLHVLADVELFSYGVSPNKVFDYMAAGVPVLTNSPGVVADLVESAHGGIAVGPRELARGLRQFAGLTEGERARLGAAGRTWIGDNQSRTAMAGRLADLLDRVAVTSPRSGRRRNGKG